MEAVTQGSELKAEGMLSTPDLIAVGMQGDDVRRRMHGTRTTFLRVFEVHVDAPLSSLPAGVSAGEFRIVGAPRTIESAVEAARAAVALAGRVPVAGFTLSGLRGLAPDRTAFADLCGQLRDAGLAAVADAPLDVFVDSDEGLETLLAARQAGLLVQRLTVHAQPAEGSAENGDRVALVERAQRLQREAGGFKAFAPLPRTMSITVPTTGYSDVRQIALARVVVTNIPSIQVDWTLYGPKLAQVALTVGADDVDGVAAVDPGMLGTRRSPIEEIKNNIRAAALEPVERDGRFELLT
jgi:hypothetical protein